MTIMKSFFRKLWNGFKSFRRRLMIQFEDMIPSTGTRWVVRITYYFLVALLAYVIALFDVGIWSGCFGVWEIIEEYFFQERWYPFILWLILTVVLTFVMHWLIKNIISNDDRNFKFSESNVYGSARELSIEDLQKVAEVKPIKELSGTILGQLDMSGQRVIGIPPNPTTNKNLIVLGTPGVGKSFSVVENLVVQAIRRGESVVCTDTKYEVRADTLELARKYGYTIRFLDLKDLKYSDGWHVLKELRCDDVRAMIFADVVMKNTGNPKDPHLALEQSLLRACCLYVERCRTIPDSERTLYTAYNMILQGPEALDKTFETAKYDRDLRVAYDAYASFKGSDNLRGNVIANLASRLQILPTARTMTSTDDIDLTLPGRQKCIYYCCMSDMHETMKFMSTLFFSFLFLDLADYADSLITRRLPIPVNVVLEEAANVGEIVGLARYLSTARSRAISITMILQGIGQLKEIYGEETTSTILNDCSIHACIGTNDEDTAKHFEWFSGEATVKVKTEQHEKFEKPFTFLFHHSTGDGKRHVYTSNEIRKIQRGYILLGWQGYDTLMCRTFGINQHPEYINGNMKIIEPHTHVPLENTEARNFLREMEQKRIDDYNAWIQDGGNPWPGYGFPQPQYDGPSRHKPAPEVIPYPELERLALEYAEGKTQITFEERMEELIPPDAPITETQTSENPDTVSISMIPQDTVVGVVSEITEFAEIKTAETTMPDRAEIISNGTENQAGTIRCVSQLENEKSMTSERVPTKATTASFNAPVAESKNTGMEEPICAAEPRKADAIYTGFDPYAMPEKKQPKRSGAGTLYGTQRPKKKQ